MAILAALPDAVFRFVVSQPAPGSPLPVWFAVLAVCLGLLVAILRYWPIRNLLGRGQMMNASFNALHLVNTYGAFGSVTRERNEIVVEGTLEAAPSEETTWEPYEFRGKPGDPMRRPPQWAPYHLRLDWQMWFLALGPVYVEPWFLRFVERLLQRDPMVLGLLRDDPFGGQAPAWVRASLYRYRYTTRQERRRTGAWWHRELVGAYLPPSRPRPERRRGATGIADG